jgi:hypothetical protein
MWLAALALLTAVPPARGTLSISWFTIDGGGAASTTGGALNLAGTVGQPDAGTCTGGVLALYGGFWCGGSGASALPDPPEGDLPTVLRILAGGPNPFAFETRFQLDLPEPCPVRIGVYDPSGRLVSRICERTLPAGRYSVPWAGTDLAGRRVPNGAYLVRIEAGATRLTQSVIRLE